jgi:hypothetical protein
MITPPVLNNKQQIQLELIAIDFYLQQIAVRYPKSCMGCVDKIRFALAHVIFLHDGVDLQEFCRNDNDDNGGLRN